MDAPLANPAWKLSRMPAADPTMAIAFYTHSIASGETYKFEEQGEKIEAAKKIERI